MWNILRFSSILPSHSFHLTFALRIECSRCFSLLIPWEKIVTIASLSLIQNLLLLFSRYIVSNSLGPHGLWHTRFLCPLPSPRVRSNSCPLSWWCYLTISSSFAPFSFCLQSFPASRSFPMRQIFASGGQSIWVSASASVLPMNTQDLFLLGWTGLILQSKGFSRVFSNDTVQKHQFFGAQLSL